MNTFNDAAGRTWSVSLNLGTAMAAKQKLGVDLLQPEAGDPPLLKRLGTDELLLGEALCALLASQFEATKVTDADVHASFDGATLLAAQNGLADQRPYFSALRTSRHVILPKDSMVQVSGSSQ